MVNLTFIRQCESDKNDIGLTVKMAERVYLLSKALTEKFGKPDCIYSSNEFRSRLTAKIANLGFLAPTTQTYSALRKESKRRDTRAFFDFALCEADAQNLKHIVIVCDANIFDFAFIQTPAVGFSCTLCGEQWKDLLQGYQSSWTPLKIDKHSVEDAKFITDKIINAVCSNTEALLVQKTMKEALDEYTL